MKEAALSTCVRRRLCGLTVFAFVFGLGSWTNSWAMPRDKWVFDTGGELRNFWEWLASLPNSTRHDRWPFHEWNVRSCAILLGVSIGLGGIGFWLGGLRWRDEQMDDFKDGALGSEKDGRLGPEHSE